MPRSAQGTHPMRGAASSREPASAQPASHQPKPLVDRALKLRDRAVEIYRSRRLDQFNFRSAALALAAQLVSEYSSMTLL